MRPIYVRTVTDEERRILEKGLRSSSAFTARRCQILLSSARRKTPNQIAVELHCSGQAVRNAIHAFETEGLACLTEKSHARHDQQAMIDEAGVKRLRELIQLSPRTFGYPTSIWSRPLLAQQLHREGYTSRQVTTTVITTTLRRHGISWRRAKQWIRSPDVHYEHRKKDETT